MAKKKRTVKKPIIKHPIRVIYRMETMTEMADRVVHADQVDQLLTELAVATLRVGPPTQRTGQTINILRWATARLRENRECEKKAMETPFSPVAVPDGFDMGRDE